MAGQADETTTVRTFRKRNQFHIYRMKMLEFQCTQCSPRDASQKLGHRRSSEVPRVCAVTYFIRNNTPLIINGTEEDQKRHRQHITHQFLFTEKEADILPTQFQFLIRVVSHLLQMGTYFFFSNLIHNTNTFHGVNYCYKA